MKPLKFIKDSYENLMAGFNGSKDATTQGRIVKGEILEFDWAQLTAIYETSGIGAKLVDIKPDDMTREWRTFTSVHSPEEVALFEKMEAELDVVRKFNYAQKMANVYGDAYIVLDINDGLDADEELIVDNLKTGCLEGITVCDPTTLQGTLPDNDPFSKNYLNYTYFIPVHNDNGLKIHYSRVLHFKGLPRSPFALRQSGGKNGSVLTRSYNKVVMCESAGAFLSNHIIKDQTEIISVDDLFDSMQDGDSYNAMMMYLSQVNSKASTLNQRVIDSNTSISIQSRDSKSVVEIYNLMREDIASDAGIPLTKFLGQSPNGFAASGESELEMYYDTVRQDQVTKFSPLLHTLDKIMVKSIDVGDEPLTYEWDSLYQLSEKELSEVNENKVNTLSKLYADNVITATQYLKEIVQEDIVTNVTEEDIDELEQLEKAANTEIQ